MFGEGNISTRKLDVRNNQNFVTSTVKIPADSSTLKSVNQKGGTTCHDQLEKWSQKWNYKKRKNRR